VTVSLLALTAGASNGPNNFGFSTEPIVGQMDNVLVVTLAPSGGGAPVARGCVPILDDPYTVEHTQATEMPGDGNPCGPPTPVADLPPGTYFAVAGVYEPGSQEAIRLYTTSDLEITNGLGIAFDSYDLSAFPGNTDCDPDADAVDALQVLRSVAALPVTANCIGSGNVDCDADRDAVDALGILRYVAQLPPLPTPQGCLPIGPSVPQD
jgi:hypothetical protein